MTKQTLTFDKDQAVLLLVDIQPDFMPGGALPVAEGDRIVEPVRALMESERFRHLVATQDWHPPGHISFASSHAGHKPMETIELYGHEQTLWPDHCVQGTPGAELHTGLPLQRLNAIVRKGMDPKCDSYSGFRNNWDPQSERPSTGLAGYLKDRGIREVFICGLARDVCVKWTAEDAAEAGFRVRVLWDLTRPVDPSSDDSVREGLTRYGVEIITSDQLGG